MTHVATINAFANKLADSPAPFGTRQPEVIRERFATYDEAKDFVRTKNLGNVRLSQLRRYASQGRIPRQCVGVIP